MGAVVGLVWGALIAAALVVRLRYLLHFAVLEAALEAAAGTGTGLKDSAQGTAYCPSCEMPLLQGANFCVVCGASVHAGSKVTRARNRVDDTVALDAPRPSLKPTPEGVAPQDNKRMALVVGAVAATIVVAGVVGQAAAAAAAAERRGHAARQLPHRPADPGRVRTDHGARSVPCPGAGPVPRRVRGCVVRRRALVYGAFDATTSPDPDDGSGGIGTTTGGDSTVVVGGDISFQKPDGYEVEQQLDGFVQVFGDGGYFFAIINPAPTDVNAMITENLDGIQSMGIQDLAISEPTEAQLPSSAVVQCVVLGFQGALATQQGGTVPLNGFAYYFVLQDGSGVTAFTLYQEGQLTDALIEGYDQMFNTLVSTF